MATAEAALASASALLRDAVKIALEDFTNTLRAAAEKAGPLQLYGRPGSDAGSGQRVLGEERPICCGSRHR